MVALTAVALSEGSTALSLGGAVARDQYSGGVRLCQSRWRTWSGMRATDSRTRASWMWWCAMRPMSQDPLGVDSRMRRCAVVSCGLVSMPDTVPSRLASRARGSPGPGPWSSDRSALEPLTLRPVAGAIGRVAGPAASAAATCASAWRVSSRTRGSPCSRSPFRARPYGSCKRTWPSRRDTPPASTPRPPTPAARYRCTYRATKSRAASHCKCRPATCSFSPARTHARARQLCGALDRRAGYPGFGLA
jgi:hypothetical protein